MYVVAQPLPLQKKLPNKNWRLKCKLLYITKRYVCNSEPQVNKVVRAAPFPSHVGTYSSLTGPGNEAIVRDTCEWRHLLFAQHGGSGLLPGPPGLGSSECPAWIHGWRQSGWDPHHQLAAIATSPMIRCSVSTSREVMDKQQFWLARISGSNWINFFCSPELGLPPTLVSERNWSRSIDWARMQVKPHPVGRYTHY